MKLDWAFNRDGKYIECNIVDGYSYRSYDGGGTITKSHNNVKVEDFVFDDSPARDTWEDEKMWISDNYSHLYGVYQPMESTSLAHMNQWHEDNPDWKEAFPCFGTYNNEYLDRLQRPSSVQIGTDMDSIVTDWKNHVKIEYHKESKQYYRREWSDEVDNFYNCQPCCVFPENPGRTPIPYQEAKEILQNYDIKI